MAETIRYYLVTKGLGKIKDGLRFQIIDKNSRHIDVSISEGLAEAAGIPLSEARNLRCNIMYEEL